MKKILVIGSLNMDTVIETPSMPEVGETISGRNITHIPGGKGANQAYSIGKLGGDIAMLGAVGDDSKGQKLIENLKSAGVDVSRVQVLRNTPTGQAFITVDDKGENSIIIIAGANGKVTKKLIDNNMDLLTQSDIVIMQLEIPLEIVEYIKDLVKNEKKIIILDPAPAVKEIPDSMWEGIDYIKPNETELQILTGMDVSNKKNIEIAARSLIKKGVKNVIVTLGGEGCMYINENTEEFFPAYHVNVVDTTAAGDCFTAAFALALSQGKNWQEAIGFGQKASAIAVTRKGAQTSIPTRKEVEEMKGGEA